MLYLYIYIAMVVGAVSTLIAMTVMRRSERHNFGEIGWLFLTLLTPPVGLCLFLIFGGRKVSAEHEQRQLVELPHPDESTALSDSSEASSPAEIGVARGLPPPSEGNRLALLDRPETMWDALFELIDSATERVYVQTFILGDDSVGRELFDRLSAKARAGLQVRLMADGFGSFALPDEILQSLRDAGGRAVKFKPMSELNRFANLNFRNHRKLVVVDGNRALVGGANLVECQMTREPHCDTWIDYSLRIDGMCARQIEAVFLSDWNFITEEDLAVADASTPSLADASANGSPPSDAATLQLVTVGPDGPDGILEDLWLTTIHRATDRVWIVSPYFVPPPGAMRSLVAAVRRGVQVKVMIPQSSDITIADYARLDYLEELDELGAEILVYPHGMVHAKMLLVDRTVAYCGSANFDMRSFYLNYELVVGILNEDRVADMAAWYESLASQCVDGPRQKSWGRRALGVAARMVAEEL